MGLNIFGATTECRKGLEECQKFELLMEANWAKIRLEDFDRWAVNIRATSRNPESQANKCGGSLAGLLNLYLWSLVDLLKECIELANPAPRSDKVSRRIPGTLPQKIREVDGFLDNLFHTHVDTERMESFSLLNASDIDFKLEEHLDLRAHLIAVILSQRSLSAEGTVSLEDIDPSSLSASQLRLVDCSLLRRHQHLHLQNYYKTLDIPSDGELRDEKGDPMVSRVTKFFQLLQCPSSSQVAAKQSSTTVVKFDYHRPPQLQDGKSLFDCPCCFQTFPASILEETRWREHLEADLCPYVCVVPYCRSSLLFPSKEEWLRHLNEHIADKYWVCTDCLDSPEFHTDELFEVHLSKYHGEIERNRVSDYKWNCQRRFPARLDSCPICAWPGTQKGKVNKRDLINHIAEELRSFSFRSLPWSPNGDHEDTEEIGRIAAKVRDWLTKHDLPTVVFQKVPGVNYD